MLIQIRKCPLLKRLPLTRRTVKLGTTTQWLHPTPVGCIIKPHSKIKKKRYKFAIRLFVFNLEIAFAGSMHATVQVHAYS